MKITRVQYDGSGKWLDVHFDNGRGFRFHADFLHDVAVSGLDANYTFDITPRVGDVKELPR